MQTKKDFNYIVNDILNNPEFIKLNRELHHGISRYDHSLNVAEKTYKMCKKFHLDYHSATRAALLHDFFTDEALNLTKEKEKLQKHPLLACENSKRVFAITKQQEDAIKCHMFPVTKEVPKYKESWIVSIADKLVAIKEWYNYKVLAAISVYILFFFYIITVQR